MLIDHSLSYSRLNSSLKINGLSNNGQTLVLKYFYLTLITAILNTVSSTFLYLQVIDKEGIQALGTILAITFIVNAVTDFPTGVLADWLGHKWILSLAYVLFGVSFGLMAFADSFNQFLIAFVVLALAEGQASGALQSWFDNNYKITCEKEDPKKEIYKEFMGKSMMYFQYGSSIFFVLGAGIASIFESGRQIVFGIQAIAMGIMAIIFARTLTTVSEKEEQKEETGEGYFTLLGNGIRFAFSTRLMTLLILSSVIFSSVAMVWYTLVLFPVYFGYTGSDMGAATLRWLIWFAGAYLTGKAGTWSKKLDEKTWLPRINMITILVFFGLTGVAVTLIDLEKSFNLAGVISILVIFITSGLFFSIGGLLNQKLYLEIIPDEMRNSIYSLLPTLSLLIGAPLVFYLGGVIDDIGFEKAIYVFTLIGVIGVSIEFIAMKYYEPKDEEVELELSLHYDVYSISNLDSISFNIPKKWQISGGVKVIWDELVSTAMDDGEVTSDEQKVLNSVMENLQEYGKAVEIALKDGVIEEEEKTLLLKLQTKLVQDAESVIMADDKVTTDEINLLNKLASIIDQINIENS